MDKKRYLKFFFPIIEDNKNLPVNLKFTQLYTGNETIENLEEDIKLEKDSFRKIYIEKYKIPSSTAYPQFNKPISKFIPTYVYESNNE